MITYRDLLLAAFGPERVEEAPSRVYNQEVVRDALARRGLAPGGDPVTPAADAPPTSG